MNDTVNNRINAALSCGLILFVAFLTLGTNAATNCDRGKYFMGGFLVLLSALSFYASMHCFGDAYKMFRDTDGKIEKDGGAP